MHYVHTVIALGHFKGKQVMPKNTATAGCQQGKMAIMGGML